MLANHRPAMDRGAAILSTTTFHQHCVSAKSAWHHLAVDSLLYRPVYGNSSPIYARCAMTAAMAVQHENPLKRTSTAAQFNAPASKKLNRGPIRHRRTSWDLQREQRREAVWQDEVSIQSMLNRSIGLALQAVGFDAAAPEALEAFRNDVETCTRRHCIALFA